MNLPNKLTFLRIILTFVIITLLLFPYDAINFEFPRYLIANTHGNIIVDSKYLFAVVLFIIAALTDFLDGYIARKYNMITDEGKMLDAIADKILVNSVLIILAAQGFIPVIIPVILILRDSIVNAIKMAAGSKGQVVAAINTGKWKTASLMVGIVLTMIYNLPFELWNINVSDSLFVIATVLSIISGVQYYYINKNFIFSKNENLEKEPNENPLI